MKLFLASEAKHPESIKKLKAFGGCDLQNKKIVYIPTAANGEYWGSWKVGKSVKVAKSLTKYFKIIELENYYKTDIFSPIEKADILWIAGGMAGYLLYWMRRVKFDKKLPEILSKGTIYVGSSAGSMVCAKTQYVSECYLGDPEPGASLLPGLGLIDFEIYPHFEDEQLLEIKKRWKKGELYLLKNGEAITVENNKVEVLGIKRVLKEGKLYESST